MLRLFRTQQAVVAEVDGHWYDLSQSCDSWSELVNRVGLHQHLQECITELSPSTSFTEDKLFQELRAPIDWPQIVMACGVTYDASRKARNVEYHAKGKSSVAPKTVEQKPATPYDYVGNPENYAEIFFKGLPNQVFTHGQEAGKRADSGMGRLPAWDVPEPEVAFFLSSQGTIEAYTLGLDMSSRSIEGACTLLLTQAKVHHLACGLNAAMIVPDPTENLLPVQMRMSISRNGKEHFTGETSTDHMKRSFQELAASVHRCGPYPGGVWVLTGTDLVPPDSFSLEDGDAIELCSPQLGSFSATVTTVNWPPEFHFAQGT